MRMMILLVVVLAAACPKRAPTPHDGTCIGRVHAAYTDCTQDVDGRYILSFALATDPYVRQNLQMQYQQEMSTCRFEYAMRQSACIAMQNPSE